MRKLLQYRISDWHQLRLCHSNISPKYHIHVSDYVGNDYMSGTKISVDHDKYGTLFAITVNPTGMCVNQLEDPEPPITVELILRELRRYGFYVYYHEEQHLPKKQIEFLETLEKLHYDKLRLLKVYQYNAIDANTYLVAFNVDLLPQWINTGRSISEREFKEALLEGSCFNVSSCPEYSKFRWDWAVNKLIDIKQLLDTNAGIILDIPEEQPSEDPQVPTDPDVEEKEEEIPEVPRQDEDGELPRPEIEVSDE